MNTYSPKRFPFRIPRKRRVRMNQARRSRMVPSPDRNREEIAQSPHAPQLPDRLSFLTLPGEIRNMIYRLVFVRSKPFGDSKKRFSTTGDNSEPIWEQYGQFGLSPALLQTCRKVYNEASHILYSENRFGIWIEYIYRSQPGSFLGFEGFFKFDGGFPQDFDGFPIRQVKQWDIVLDSSKKPQEYSQGLWHILDVCNFIKLSWNPDVDISVHFEGAQHGPEQWPFLMYFRCLQNVQSQTFHGPPCNTIGRLKRLLREYTWRNDLSRVYIL